MSVSFEDLKPFDEESLVYIYEHVPPDGQGIVECLAVVAMKRDHGFLLVLPAGVLTEEELATGSTAPMDAPIGPSHHLELQAAQLAAGGTTPIPDIVVNCLVVDMAISAVENLVPLATGRQLQFSNI